MSEITMPQLSESMAEGRLLRWHVRVGSQVRPGVVIAEVETDKANMDIEAVEAGTIIELRVAPGAVAAVGSILAVYVPHGAPLSRSLATDVPRPSSIPQVAAAPAAGAAPNVSPLAARLAGLRGIDLSKVHGTGPGGRIMKEDVVAWRAEPARSEPPQWTAPTLVEDSASEPAPAFATPPPADSVVVAMAAEVSPAAPESEIDDEEFSGSAATDAPAVTPAPASEAQNLSAAAPAAEPCITRPLHFEAPHAASAAGAHGSLQPELSAGFVQEKPVSASPVRGFFRGSVSINVSALVDAHAGILARFKVAGADFASPYTPVFLKAAAIALLDQPGMTGPSETAVGISISVPRPGGLKHYVMHDCGHKPLSVMFREYAALASEGVGQVPEVSETDDVVLSVSDLSAFGVDEFSAVAHPYCHAFLSLGAIIQSPVARGRVIETAHILMATLVINQEKVNMLAAAKFLRDFRELLEHPILLAGN